MLAGSLLIPEDEVLLCLFRGPIDSLPGPQRRPLAIALLRDESGGGDLDFRAVSTGLAALLTLLADTEPLLLAVDDAQWLDQASGKALGFALRRLGDRPVRLVTSVRLDGSRGRHAGAFCGIEMAPGRDACARIVVGPLSVAALHQVFVSLLGSSFPRPMLTRIHTAAGSNPFYALEINQVGAPPPGHPLPVPDDQRDLAQLRVRRLPRPTRQVLAMMASMPRPIAGTLAMAALSPAERVGIVRVRHDGIVEFTHPLFGSALYASLPEGDPRQVHRELAERAASQEERASTWPWRRTSRTSRRQLSWTGPPTRRGSAARPTWRSS